MSNAQSMIQSVSSIFTSAEKILEAMPNGSRVQLKELAQSVSANSDLNPKDVLTFVTHFARNTDLGYVSRGKNGGLIRGTKQTSKITKTTTSDTSEVSEEDDSDQDQE